MHSILSEVGVQRRRRGYRDPSERQAHRKRFADLVRNGESVSALALEWRISRTTAYQWCRDHGVRSNARELAHLKSERVADAVRRMVRQGMTVAEAAIAACTSKATARRALNAD